MFWLQDPIVLPSPRYAFTLSVPFIAVHLTHYVISAANGTLDISYPEQLEPSIIEFPVGNHNIDELVDVLNRRLLFGFKAAYSETQTRYTSHRKPPVPEGARRCPLGPLQPVATSSGSASETRASSDHIPRRTESISPAPHRSTYAPTCGLGTVIPAP